MKIRVNTVRSRVVRECEQQSDCVSCDETVIDGGTPSSIYGSSLCDLIFDGGTPDSIYTDLPEIDGGNP